MQNLRTGNISLEFHVVYDDFFETVHAMPEQEPVQWKELISFQSYRSDLDDETYVPQLADEWLSPDELKSCQIEQLERREMGDNKLPTQLNLPNQDQHQEVPPVTSPEIPQQPLSEQVLPSLPSPTQPPPQSSAEEPLRHSTRVQQSPVRFPAPDATSGSVPPLQRSPRLNARSLCNQIAQGT